MINWGRRGHDVLLAAFLVLLSPTLSGCSGDDEADETPSARIPIHFSANIGGGEDDDATSRATMDGTGTAWAGGEHVRIQLDDKASLQYTVGTDKSSLSQTTAGAANVYYWYPVPASHDYAMKAWSFGNTTDPGTTVPSSFSIATDQNGTNTELLYAHQTISYGGTPTSKTAITFYHQLAQVIVKVTYKEPYNATSTSWSKVASITYGSSSSKLPLSGTYVAPTTGNYGSWTKSTTDMGVITPKTTTATAGAEVYSAVLIPGSYAAGQVLFAITLSDNKSSTFLYALPSATTFNAGSSYTYNVTVDDVKIRFTGITVNNWATASGTINL
jgi:hypothetical protein